MSGRWTFATVATLTVCTACSGTEGVSSAGGDCTSYYTPVASASTWPRLEHAMLAFRERGRVASVRVQAQGKDVGAGDHDAVRVVDLLDRKGRRLIQVDVWRTESGGWRAGLWNQCID